MTTEQAIYIGLGLFLASVFWRIYVIGIGQLMIHLSAAMEWISIEWHVHAMSMKSAGSDWNTRAHTRKQAREELRKERTVA